MKKLTLTALLTAATLTSVAFAAPMRSHHQQMDYSAEQTDQVQYTGNVIIAPRLASGTKESDSGVQAKLAAYARIAPARAAELAFAQAPGNVNRVRLGVDKGVLVYEVIVGNTEVTINALSGVQWGHNEHFSSTAAALAEEQGGATQ